MKVQSKRSNRKSSKPKLLDLFCGGGGGAMGYARAGFDIMGIDINWQGEYPFNFARQDAFAFARRHGSEFDIIHASPPCQAYSLAGRFHGPNGHPDMLGDVRDMLIEIGKPYIIENVMTAPIRPQLMLCGTMFGLRIKKHRLFESNLKLPKAPGPCGDHSRVYNPFHGEHRTMAAFREAMGIDWLGTGGGQVYRRAGDLSDAIPPAYTEYIGLSILKRSRLSRPSGDPSP